MVRRVPSSPSRCKRASGKGQTRVRGREELSFDRRAVKSISFRVKFIAGLICFPFLFIVWNLVNLQVVNYSDLLRETERHFGEMDLTPRRGVIKDRLGEELAISTEVDSVFMVPIRYRDRYEDREKTAKILSSLFEVEEDVLIRRLERGNHFAWVKRRVSPNLSARVMELGLDGVGLRTEIRRYYPGKELAAHVLGFVGIDGEGLEGLELALDQELMGTRRSAQVIRDARGRNLLTAVDIKPEKLAGGSVTLTIDRTIQYHAEKALFSAIENYGAKAGSVVVTDPRTGEILALANYPTYDPNKPGLSNSESRRNRAVTDIYEPGSVFKVFTIASVLDKGLAEPHELIDCGMGRMRIGARFIRDTQPHKELSVSDIMKYSSNIGSAVLVSRLGREALVDSLKEYGFGRRTGSGMPGEQRGIIRSADSLSDLCLATVAFGQGVSATPLQVAAALGAVANGGTLMKPWLVSEIVNEGGDTLHRGKPEIMGYPLKEETARIITEMMERSVKPGGTGMRASLPGYRVAGKTGTSQKVDPVLGRYSPDKRIASFAGFLPSDKPKLLIHVVVDEPQDVVYGGLVAAPVFRQIAEEAVRYLGIAPSYVPEYAEIVESVISGDIGFELPALILPPPEGQTLVPDLEGKDLRTAARILSERRLYIRSRGAGVVKEQRPPRSTAISPGEVVEVVLAPRT